MAHTSHCIRTLTYKVTTVPALPPVRKVIAKPGSGRSTRQGPGAIDCKSFANAGLPRHGTAAAQVLPTTMTFERPSGQPGGYQTIRNRRLDPRDRTTTNYLTISPHMLSNSESLSLCNKRHSDKPGKHGGVRLAPPNLVQCVLALPPSHRRAPCSAGTG